jgi:hypothetical protein
MTTLRMTSLTVSEAIHSVLVKMATVHVPSPVSHFGLGTGETIVPQATHDEAKLNSALSDLWSGQKIPRAIVQIQQRQGAAVAILFSWIAHELLKVYDEDGPSPQQVQHVDLARMLERCNQNDGKNYFVDAEELATLIGTLCTTAPVSGALGSKHLVAPMSIPELLSLFGMHKNGGTGPWIVDELGRGRKGKLSTARTSRGQYDPIEVFRIVKARGKATGPELLTAKRTLADRMGIDVADFDEQIK